MAFFIFSFEKHEDSPLSHTHIFISRVFQKIKQNATFVYSISQRTTNKDLFSIEFDEKIENK